MTESTQRRVDDLIAELEWRGLLHQCTDREGLAEHLKTGTRKIYAGFDPTADSLTIGNLVPIMMLAHVKRAGHTPIVVMGGGTGLIGDPSGKSAERQLMTAETVQHHIDKQRPIFDNVLGQIEGAGYEVMNNADWLGEISYLEALRDVGKFFSVNMMMQKESVKARLESREQGISYTEFSYMILQAYDFAHLYEEQGVTCQFGGSDQYGNIVAGGDLIRRKRAVADDAPVGTFGLTAPLVQKADGGKFGKTEAGAVWLTAERTSPYAYYQFWLNASDADAANWIKVFTFLTRDEVDALLSEHAEQPGARALQRRLAQEATSILHGPDAMQQAEAAGKALFSGDIASLDEQTLREVLADVPSSEKDRADLVGDGYNPVELLKEVGLASSNREAREFIANGSVSINGTKLAPDTPLTEVHLLHGSLMAIRRGKKKWHLVRWS
ncbi:MAG: tyrosine--tRNA ligase [Planctomycetota bacterium]